MSICHDTASDVVRVRSSNGSIDSALIFRDNAFNNSNVSFCDLIISHLLGYFVLRERVLGNDENTRCISVKSVDKANLKMFAGLIHSVHESIGAGTGGIALGRVDHKAGLLVDEEKILVFINGEERNVLSFKIASFLRENYCHHIACVNLVPAFCGLTIKSCQFVSFDFISES